VHIAPPKAAGEKKSKKVLGISIASGAAVLAVVIWAILPAKKADEPQEKPITFEENTAPSDQPSHGHRSSSARAAEPAPRTTAANSNDRIRSQALTASGYRRMKDRDFSGAAQDFQDALKLDPSNTAAQKGLQTAQAGSTVQGITGIFHR